MRLEPAEIRIVKQTYAMVNCVVTTASKLFYERLFELAPELRGLFKGDLRSQGFKLMATLKFMVDALDNPVMMASLTQRLGQQHSMFGVTEEYYDVFGQALLWMLQQTLGRSFTPEVRDAWANAYTLWTDMMKEAAKESVVTRA